MQPALIAFSNALYRSTSGGDGGGGGGGGGGGTVNWTGTVGAAMQQPGDQVLVVGNGTKTGGGINPAASVHPVTTGTYKGRLVLVAETKGGVVVDGATTGFHLGIKGGPNRNFRILFVGFKFLNVDVDLWNSCGVWFWHCEFTAPDWLSQYIAAGGSMTSYSPAALNAMANPEHRLLNIVGEVGVGGPYDTDIGVYGCDLHGCKNDALYIQGAIGLEVIGNQIWDIYHYRQSPPNESGGYLWHSDAIQIEWLTGGTISDNFIGGNRQYECYDANITNLVNSNNWLGGSPQIGGVLLDKMSRNFVNTSFTNERWWGGGQYINASGGFTSSPTYGDPGYDIYLFNAQTGTQSPPSGVTVTGTVHGPPSGVPMSGGLVTDLPGQASARIHASNPANIWRAANPYNSWVTYFASKW